jgi:ArsR family transcriptional regulator, arsenate/arsenite/antimonite-responsive transcriptional repressor
MHIIIADLSKLYSVLGEPIRLRIVNLLLERELCVCEIMSVLKQPQYKVSRHLAILKKAGLLHDWREGVWIHYEINPALPSDIRKSLYDTRALWDKVPALSEDLAWVRRTSRRQPGVPVACAN